MAVAKKNYRAFTGLKEFYYGELSDDDKKITAESPERVQFLQDIAISTPQEVVKAFGDNEVAELAVSTSTTTLSTTFHKLPIEDKIRLYGMKKVNGMAAVTNNMTPPYVACAFAKTAEDGGTEWIGFAKGMFTIPDENGKTKEESVEFGNAETSAEFMPREVEGSNEKVVYLLGYDKPGETTNRDALFMAIFGVAHPDAEAVAPGV